MAPTGGPPLKRFSLPRIPLEQFLAYVHASGGFLHWKSQSLHVFSTHELHRLGLPVHAMPGRGLPECSKPGVLPGHSLSSAACMDMVAIGVKRLVFIDKSFSRKHRIKNLLYPIMYLLKQASNQY